MFRSEKKNGGAIRELRAETLPAELPREYAGALQLHAHNGPAPRDPAARLSAATGSEPPVSFLQMSVRAVLLVQGNTPLRERPALLPAPTPPDGSE